MVNSPVKASSPGLWCTRSFLTTALISLVVINLFRLSASSWFSLEDFILLEICPFSLGCTVSWHIVVNSNSSQSLILLWYLFFSLFFCSWFYFFGSSLFFFLMSVFKGLSIFIMFWKKTHLGYIDSLIVFFSLYVISFCSDLDCLFPYTQSGPCFLLFL